MCQNKNHKYLYNSTLDIDGLLKKSIYQFTIICYLSFWTKGGFIDRTGRFQVLKYPDYFIYI